MKILIDLDILTIALWKGMEKDLAMKFLRRVKSGEFKVYTPYVLFELLSKWKDRTLADKILDFYKLHSTEIITFEQLSEKLQERKINLIGLSINRKHLRNKSGLILQFLKEKGLKQIEVVLPNEI